MGEDEDDAEDDAVLADADSEHGGNGKKKLKKKIKVLEIKKEARRRKVANAAHKSNAKKKIKKKIKADDKQMDADKRKDAAHEKKEEQQEEQEDGGEGDSDDGAVSFLQYEAATGDNAVLKPEGLSLLLEHFASKLSAQDDEEGEDPDVCDSAVQEQLFNAADADGSGKVSAQELVDTFHMPQEEADGFVHATDSNGDGEVSLEELQAFFAEVVCHDNATMKLKAHDDGHGTGGAMKKLKKKLKAETKIAEAHAHIDEMKDSKKKLKKKQKADEEHGDDGAVSFLQEDEDDAEDDAVLAD